MRNGIVYYPKSNNRGDDIQSYAASILTEGAELCDREKLNLIEIPTKLPVSYTHLTLPTTVFV